MLYTWNYDVICQLYLNYQKKKGLSVLGFKLTPLIMNGFSNAISFTIHWQDYVNFLLICEFIN